LLSLAGFVGILLARAAQTVFITGRALFVYTRTSAFHLNLLLKYNFVSGEGSTIFFELCTIGWILFL
jgi:hypothetical protein